MLGRLDSHPPPPDLDVPAARAAARHYRAAIARGIAKEAAWQAAAELFALHHPAWPVPLAEREAARTVGALVGWERGALPARPAPPIALLKRLSGAVVPTTSPFRLAIPLEGHPFPIPARLPVLRERWPANEPRC